jgi:hypothetical protein
MKKSRMRIFFTSPKTESGMGFIAGSSRAATCKKISEADGRLVLEMVVASQSCDTAKNSDTAPQQGGGPQAIALRQVNKTKFDAGWGPVPQGVTDPFPQAQGHREAVITNNSRCIGPTRSVRDAGSGDRLQERMILWRNYSRTGRIPAGPPASRPPVTPIITKK